MYSDINSTIIVKLIIEQNFSRSYITRRRLKAKFEEIIK